MKPITTSLRGVLAAVVLAGCGARAPAPSAAPTPTTAAPGPASPPPAAMPDGTPSDRHDRGNVPGKKKLRRGHYATPNGLFGLVLDRMGSVPLARIDGKPEVLELAVRHTSQEDVALVSADGKLVILVDRHGWTTLPPEGGGTTSTRLVRDGEGEALTPPAAPSADEALIRSVENDLATRCGTKVLLEVDKATTEEAQRGLHHGVHRVASALSAVCRDASGKAAVGRKIGTVRLRPKTVDAATFRLDRGVLVVEAAFDREGFGPFVDEIQRWVEGHL